MRWELRLERVPPWMVVGVDIVEVGQPDEEQDDIEQLRADAEVGAFGDAAYPLVVAVDVVTVAGTVALHRWIES